MNHGKDVSREVGEDQKLISWAEFGEAMAQNSHEWVEFILEWRAGRLKGDPCPIDWFVDRMHRHAILQTAGNCGVVLIDWDEDGILVSHD